MKKGLIPKIAIIVMLVAALVLSISAILSGVVLSNSKVVTASKTFDKAEIDKISGNASGKAVKPFTVISAPGVLDLVDSSVHIKIDSDPEVKLQLAIGQSNDISAWLLNNSYCKITGLDSWTDLSSSDVVQSANGNTNSIATSAKNSNIDKINNLQLIDSDMWASVVKNNVSKNETEINLDWDRQHIGTWSFLLLAQNIDSGKSFEDREIDNVTVTFTWNRQSNSVFMYSGLLLAALLFIGALSFFFIYRAKNSNSRHSGNSLRLSDFINKKSKNLDLPGVVDSELNGNQVNANYSLLPDTTMIPAINPSLANSSDSKIVGHEEYENMWRYYGEGISGEKYYESHTPQGTTLQYNPTGLVSEIEQTGSYITGSAPVINSPLTDTFNVQHSFGDDKKISRKEMRKKGLFKDKKKGRH
ncbi:MAG: hypothetical protein LBM13_05295 [Candidatus Ancillula sp.]|jgi:hypothetical protein|nr:hypothetical protein [Candidatus Ancillula sp.]